ncbi:hypothetical protein FRB95_002777 [Tulasnella sp. JGI-2019a]|nr:hypothetical protein FRB93_001819 [Tulasnella sp. JGI-2019a]KAG9031413.1 hypothetical protein FRB95_002777 [Tulasnella sp. JGI-2019a]
MTEKEITSGFEATANITFVKYTATPIPHLQYGFETPCMSDPQDQAIDWSHLCRRKPPILANRIWTLYNGDIMALRDQLSPANHLDLSFMAACGMLPKAMLHSRPDLNRRNQLCDEALLVNSLDDIHTAIAATILPNLHYTYRVLHHIFRWGKLQVHSDLAVDLVPAMGDDSARRLIHAEQEDCDMVWARLKVHCDEVKKPEEQKLGLATWVWMKAGKWCHPGTVQFTYIPGWLMPLDKLQQPYLLAESDWFKGIHASCISTGATHVIIYTGEYVVIAVFDHGHDGVSFSTPEPVGITNNGDALNSKIRLNQVIGQILLNATRTPKPPKDAASLSKNALFKFKPSIAVERLPPHNPNATTEEIRHSMRFSQRDAKYPTSVSTQELPVGIEAHDTEIEMEIEQPLAQLPTPPLTLLRKRSRSESEHELPTPSEPPALPIPKATTTARLLRSLCSAAQLVVRSCVRRIGARKTKRLDAEEEAAPRPAKRIRTMETGSEETSAPKVGLERTHTLFFGPATGETQRDAVLRAVTIPQRTELPPTASRSHKPIAKRNVKWADSVKDRKKHSNFKKRVKVVQHAGPSMHHMIPAPETDEDGDTTEEEDGEAAGAGVQSVAESSAMGAAASAAAISVQTALGAGASSVAGFRRNYAFLVVSTEEPEHDTKVEQGREAEEPTGHSEESAQTPLEAPVPSRPRRSVRFAGHR